MAIKEMEIKTRIKYHFTSTKRTTMKNTDSNKCWQQCGHMDCYNTAGGYAK